MTIISSIRSDLEIAVLEGELSSGGLVVDYM